MLWRGENISFAFQQLRVDHRNVTQKIAKNIQVAAFRLKVAVGLLSVAKLEALYRDA